MRSVGLTRAGIIRPIVDFLESVGAPVGKLLERANLPAWARADPEVLIPTSGVVRLLAEGVRTQGIRNLGLRAGQDARIETLGIFGRLIRRSPTLGEALEELVTNHPTFSSNGRMWLRCRGERVEFCQAFTNVFDKLDDGWRQANHYLLMIMLGVLRLGGDPTWRPTQVQLQTGESDALRDAEPLAAAHVTFGEPATVITLPRALLDRPLSRPAGDIHVPRESVDAWRASAPSRDFVASIAHVVELLSWEGYPDIHLTASVLDMSVRTLQRHLASAGSTHEQLIGRARFATAAAVLEESDSKILDIALDLGYSDHAHFTRAFRRWAGCSPQEYRRRCRRTPSFSMPVGAQLGVTHAAEQPRASR